MSQTSRKVILQKWYTNRYPQQVTTIAAGEGGMAMHGPNIPKFEVYSNILAWF